MGNPVVSENFKAAFPQKGHGRDKQTKVLKRSAAETDAGQSVRSADAIASGGDHARHRHVESRGDFACSDIAAKVADYRLDGGAQIDLKRVAILDFEPTSYASRPAAR